MTTLTPADLNDIQGDVLLGFPKRNESFLFFNIDNVPAFKTALRQFLPAITTSTQVQAARQAIADFKKRVPAPAPGELLKTLGTNIGFTAQGLRKLGVLDSVDNNGAFTAGQLSRAADLGDEGAGSGPSFSPEWLPPFKGEIDVIAFVAGDSPGTVTEGVNAVRLAFGNTVTFVLQVDGQVRPGTEKGHEHFGFLDCISQPAIEQLTGHLPGQEVVDPTVLILRPDETDPLAQLKNNGSFLVYRHLPQLVPEFTKFLADNPIQDPTLNLTTEQRSALLGARMVGRWKSGAPVQIAQLEDDPVLATDPQRNNDFSFDQSAATMAGCPFFGHVRKTNPRNDIDSSFLHTRAIRRAGIPFGPEVSDAEAASGTTAVGPDGVIPRGLAFTCYQSIIENGFEFLQEAWANTRNFPFKNEPDGDAFITGFDPIIGQAIGAARSRDIHGVFPSDPIDNDTAHTLTMPDDFVVSRGGAYFFVPSLTALRGRLTTSPP